MPLEPSEDDVPEPPELVPSSLPEVEAVVAVGEPVEPLPDEVAGVPGTTEARSPAPVVVSLDDEEVDGDSVPVSSSAGPAEPPVEVEAPVVAVDEAPVSRTCGVIGSS